MLKQGKGNIVNLACTYGVVSSNPALYIDNSLASPVAYSASKDGVIMLTKIHARYRGGRGMRFNALIPLGVWNKHEESVNQRFSRMPPHRQHDAARGNRRRTLVHIKWRMDGAYQDGMPTSHGDVEIGSDVWLGSGALILSGVQIGHGAVVAARSVVTRDVPPYAIAAGLPARVVRLRHSEQQVRQMLEVRWWDWPDDKIREAVPLLSSDRVEEFLGKYCVGPAGG